MSLGMYVLVSNWLIIILYVSLNIIAGQLFVRLELQPWENMFCTGDRLELHCHHNMTHSQPDWRIVNDTGQELRTITFQGSTLQHHRIITDTTVEDVLEISNILSSFDRLTYMCFYATSHGEVQSNTFTLKLYCK